MLGDLGDEGRTKIRFLLPKGLQCILKAKSCMFPSYSVGASLPDAVSVHKGPLRMLQVTGGVFPGRFLSHLTFCHCPHETSSI